MRDTLVDYQQETGQNYNLEATPAEGTCYRLASIRPTTSLMMQSLLMAKVRTSQNTFLHKFKSSTCQLHR
jgi:hypothetical protein